MGSNEATGAPVPSTERLLAVRASVRDAGQVEPGVWYDDFDAVKAAAERTGRPLFAMWINPGCSLCKRFCTHVLDGRFSEFVREIGAYLWLGSRTDAAGPSGPGWDFAIRQNEEFTRHYFPLCAMWQCAAGDPDAVLHDCRVSGQVLEAGRTGEEGLRTVISAIGRALSEPPHKLGPDPAPTAQGGHDGCPAGHPHLKALRQISEIVRKFDPPESGNTGFAVRFRASLDAAKRERIVRAIAEGGGHCPCKSARTEDTVCLCREFRETGKCDCGLFERY